MIRLRVVSVKTLEGFNSGKRLYFNTEVFDRNFLRVLMEDTFDAEIKNSAALDIDNLCKQKFDFVKGKFIQKYSIFVQLLHI